MRPRRGEILVSAETAAFLPTDCLGDSKAPGILLLREPPGHDEKRPYIPRPKMPPEPLAHCLSPAIRAHVLAGGGTSEHRPVTIAFIRFEGTDALIEQHGAQAAADALHQLVSVVEAATEELDVAFLASDVDHDGGKLILTAGAPKATGDDEEHMLLALRKIADAKFSLPIRIGVHRGSVFAGDIGPPYRRTYTVMGDAVNLTARVMAKAEPGHVYATGDVLDRSNTLFDTTQLEPFAVKGKAEPIQAWSVGRAKGSRTRQVTLQRLPLTGRNAELGVIRKAFTSARSGAGRLIEIVGDSGIGKTRLLEALSDAAAGFQKLQATCEAYTASIPYVVWRELLREMLEFGRDTPDADIVARLRAEIATRAPDLTPWLPLLAAVFDVEIAPTPEVELLAESNRRTKLHETVARFLEVMVPDKLLVEIDDAHHMDKASAELLAHLTGGLASRPWLFAIGRRPSGTGFEAAETPEVVRDRFEADRAAGCAAAGPAGDRAKSAAGARPRSRREAVGRQSAIPARPVALGDRFRRRRGTARVSRSGHDDADRRAGAGRPRPRSPRRRVRPDVPPADVVLALFRGGRSGTRRRSAVQAARTVRRGARRVPALPPHAVARLGLRGTAVQASTAAARRGRRAASRRKWIFRRRPAASCRCTTSKPANIRSAWRYAMAAAKRAEGVYANVEAAGLYARALEAGRQIDGHGTAGARCTYTGPWVMRGTARPSSGRRPKPTPPPARSLRATRSRTPDCCSSFRMSRRSSANAIRRCDWCEQARSTSPRTGRKRSRPANGPCRRMVRDGAGEPKAG